MKTIYDATLELADSDPMFFLKFALDVKKQYDVNWVMELAIEKGLIIKNSHK